MKSYDELIYRNDLATYVSALTYDFPQRRGTLTMPPVCCTDMTGTIALFQHIDPHVKRIDTFAGEQQDVTYLLIGGQWKAVSYKVAKKLPRAQIDQ